MSKTLILGKKNFDPTPPEARHPLELKSRQGDAARRIEQRARRCCGRVRSGGFAARRTRRCGRCAKDGALGCWQQPKLPAWEVPKRDPHERWPRAPECELEELAAEIAELAAALDDSAGGDITA